MRRTSLDIYDDMPTSMKKYISNYGWHFNKKAYEYALSYMRAYNKTTNKNEQVVGYTKENVDRLLKQYNVSLDNQIMYDYVYVATMCKADYLGKSIPNEQHLVMFIKDTVDDVDASDETTFRRWLATMIGNGIPIDWNELV